jgi:hypothetical protein
MTVLYRSMNVTFLVLSDIFMRVALGASPPLVYARHSDPQHEHVITHAEYGERTSRHVIHEMPLNGV